MGRVYLIGIRWADFGSPSTPFDTAIQMARGPRIKEVDMAVAGLGDWLRYNADTWLVFTAVDAQMVFERVRLAVNANDNVIVLPIDNSAGVAGSAPRQVWDIVLKRAPESPFEADPRNNPFGLSYKPDKK